MSENKEVIKYDVIGIGSGTTIRQSLRRLSKSGKKVALVEMKDVGGTCINWGCIPTKTLIHSAEVIHVIEKAPLLGVNVEKYSIDFKKVIEHERSVAKYVSKGTSKNLKKHFNIIQYKGKASFVSPHEIKVEPVDYPATEHEIKVDKTIYLKADYFIIGTGSKPAVPPIKGLSEVNYLTSEDVLSLDTLPKNLAIIGGGAIGCEFGWFFKKMGANVTLFEFMDHLLFREDHEIINLVEEYFRNIGIEFHVSTKVESVEKLPDGKIKIVAKKNDEIIEHVADALLVATGRVPNVEDLNLEAAGVEYDPKTGIKVNEYLQTTTPHIYAGGDAIGGYMFNYVAEKEAHVIAANLLGEKKTVDYRVIPRATFLHPPVVSVGLTEQECKEKGLDYRTSKYYFRWSGRAIGMEERVGVAKLIVSNKDDKILGCHIFGVDADNLIQDVLVVMSLDLPVSVIGETIHLHPVLTEILMNAAQMAMENKP